MEGLSKMSSSKIILISIVFLQVALLLTILFDISPVRQVLGFVYLTCVPGFAILRLMRLKLEALETGLFLVGLSIVFLMIEGFLLNLLGPLVGILNPLGIVPVFTATSLFVIISLLLRINDYFEPIHFSLDRKSVATIAPVLAAILILSVFGGVMAGAFPQANVITFALLIVISSVIGLVAFSGGVVSSRIYPIIIFIVALALLLNVSLFSRYIVGGDIYGEYSLFQNTLLNLHWDSTAQLGYNAMLSITILPTIYSVILNLDGTWLFKIVYPLIFALVPLGLYRLFTKKVNQWVAFFSVFFFISNITFYTELLQLARQMIGELFYVLLFITIFSDNLKGFSKWVFFVLFSFGLIISHYSLAYIFLASLIVIWALSMTLKKHTSKITAAMILLFAVLAFTWFIYISSGSTFNNFINASTYIRNNFLTDFFNPASRSGTVLQAVGASGIPSLWHTIGRYQFYFTEAFVIIGFLGLLLKKRLSFLNDDFNVLILFNLLILSACIIIPNFAGSFNVTRFYHLNLFFLAPLCVLGGIAALKLLTRKKIRERYLGLFFVLLVLVPYFLFQTGFVYELAKDESASLPLSGYRSDSMALTKIGVITNLEVSSLSWLSRYANSSRSVYADLYSDPIFAYVGTLGRADFSSISTNNSHYTGI